MLDAQSPREISHAGRDHYSGQAFFIADLIDISIKDDLHSMEHPMFSLAKNKDTAVRSYEHNGNTIEIKPGSDGMPTMWDKDIIIFVASQIVEALNRRRSDAQERIVRFRAYDYFLATNRQPSGANYARLVQGLDRLVGMRIKTNIRTAKEVTKENFGLLERWRIIERSSDDSRMVAVEVQLSDWLHKAILAKEVLTVAPGYFDLTGSMERRVYELARKHCGAQPSWRVSVDVMYKKTGSSGNVRDFRRLLRRIARANVLPDYLLAVDHKHQIVSITNRKRMADVIGGAAKGLA